MLRGVRKMLRGGGQTAAPLNTPLNTMLTNFKSKRLNFSEKFYKTDDSKCYKILVKDKKKDLLSKQIQRNALLFAFS